MSRVSNVKPDQDAPLVAAQGTIDVTSTVNQTTVNAALATAVAKINAIIDALEARGVVRKS